MRTEAAFSIFNSTIDISSQSSRPGLAENIAPGGGPGSDVIVVDISLVSIQIVRTCKIKDGLL